MDSGLTSVAKRDDGRGNKSSLGPNTTLEPGTLPKEPFCQINIVFQLGVAQDGPPEVIPRVDISVEGFLE